jgi:hypothetical protein
MKTLFVMLLCGSLLLEGCYSYRPVTASGQRQLRSTESDDIILTLNDGSRIESRRDWHFEVTEPSAFIFGEGEGRRSKGASSSANSWFFSGKIDWRAIDSVKLLSPASGPLLRCWRSDSTIVDFRPGHYVILTPDSGTGFWAIGTRNDSSFQGRILPESILEIEASRFSMMKTAPLVLLAGFCVVGAAFLSIRGPNAIPY